MTLLDAITEASKAGYRIHQDEDGWWVTTPKRPRRPSEVLGSHHDEARAWFAACSMSRRQQ